MVGLLGLSCWYKRFLPCLGCSGQPSTKYVFLTVHFSISVSISPSKLGRQPCWVACLLVCVSDCNRRFFYPTICFVHLTLHGYTVKRGSCLLIAKFLRGIFMVFLPTVFTTAASAETLIFHCIGRMLGLNPGLLRLWH